MDWRKLWSWIEGSFDHGLKEALIIYWRKLWSLIEGSFDREGLTEIKRLSIDPRIKIAHRGYRENPLEFLPLNTKDPSSEDIWEEIL